MTRNYHIKTIIIEDDINAVRLIELYSSRIEEIDILGTYRDPIKGLETCRNQQVDLLFLDINMPKLSGIEIGKMIGNQINIIFTTAYSEYAVESYEIGAIDYLVKPISFSRFITSVNRVKKKMHYSFSSIKIAVKSGYTSYRLSPEEILYLKKEGNYIFYHLRDRKILARETISEALQKLTDSFLQCHRSYILNTENIDKYDAEYCYIGESKIPISNSFKSDWQKRVIKPL